MSNDIELGVCGAGGSVDRSVINEISDRFHAQDIFRAKYWCGEEAVLFLVGVHRETHIKESFGELQLLDGRVLRDPEDTEIIEVIWSRFDRLCWVFEKSGKMGKHRMTTFVKWGMEEKAISCIGWVDDAIKKGFLNEKDLGIRPSSDMDALDARERHSLYKIMYALMQSNQNKPGEHGYIKWLVRQLDLFGVPIKNSETVSKHIDAAVKYCKSICDKNS